MIGMGGHGICRPRKMVVCRHSFIALAPLLCCVLLLARLSRINSFRDLLRNTRSGVCLPL